MPKNIVACCDGTANEFERDRTNVVKLFYALVKDPAIQSCYYHPGVGTMAAPGFVTKAGAKVAEIAGLAFGYGLNNDICDIYTFICRNFEPQDRLYLFGFSRGAYTVRAIASLLHMYGLVFPHNERLVPYAVRMMWAVRRLQKKAKPGAKTDPRISEYFGQANEFKATFSRECKPHFVGVWDTVSSVGWFSHPLSLPYTTNNPDIAVGRHAVALDERRAFFRTNLWRPSKDPDMAGPKDMKQVWFPGVHCDVGGGYPESESGLSKIALKWMLDEARLAGLVLDEERVSLVLGSRGHGYAPPDPDGCLHNSLTAWWRLAEFVPKPHWDGVRTTWRANRSRHRTLPPTPWVHDAAWIRDKGRYAERLPKGGIRLGLGEGLTRGISATGKFNLLLMKKHLGSAIANGVVARIQRVAERGAQESLVEDYRDVVIPAGPTVSTSVDVEPGWYRIQAFLPSGQILQTDRTIGPDEVVDVRFEPPSSGREWLSWQRYEGNAPEAGALVQLPPIRRAGKRRSARGVRDILGDVPRVIRHAAGVDAQGLGYLLSSLGRALLDSLNQWRNLVGAVERGATLLPLTQPSDLSGDALWDQLAGVVDPKMYFCTWTPAAETNSFMEVGLKQREGAVSLWRVTRPEGQLSSTHAWLLMEASDTVEVARVPLPWLDPVSGQYAEAEALVDESGSRRGARLSLTVRDNTLGGLLAYLGCGCTPAARVLLDALDQKGLVSRAIAEKEANPFAACASAYAGLALFEPSERERWDNWLPNIVNWFPWLPDGAIVHARRIILRPNRPDERGQALTALKTAFRAGIPYFSAGVFHLRDGLSLYASKDAEAKTMLETVSRLAGRIDRNQAFTVIRYPKG